MPKNKPAKQASKQSTAKRRDRPTRAERLEAARRQRNRRVLLGRLAIAGGVAVVLLGVAFVVISDRMAEAEWIAAAEAGSCRFDRESDTDAGAGNNHVANPVYEVEPPAGGNHDLQAAAAGVYDAGATPPVGQLVHALEHGYVILWHQPDLGDDQREVVLDVRNAYERDTLVVPRPGLTVPVAATAWHQRLLCDQVEPDSLGTFVRNARNKGPEDVPH